MALIDTGCVPVSGEFLDINLTLPGCYKTNTRNKIISYKQKKGPLSGRAQITLGIPIIEIIPFFLYLDKGQKRIGQTNSNTLNQAVTMFNQNQVHLEVKDDIMHLVFILFYMASCDHLSKTSEHLSYYKSFFSFKPRTNLNHILSYTGADEGVNRISKELKLAITFFSENANDPISKDYFKSIETNSFQIGKFDMFEYEFTSENDKFIFECRNYYNLCEIFAVPQFDRTNFTFSYFTETCDLLIEAIFRYFNIEGKIKEDKNKFTWGTEFETSMVFSEQMNSFFTSKLDEYFIKIIHKNKDAFSYRLFDTDIKVTREYVDVLSKHNYPYYDCKYDDTEDIECVKVLEIVTGVFNSDIYSLSVFEHNNNVIESLYTEMITRPIPSISQRYQGRRTRRRTRRSKRKANKCK